MKKGFLKIQCTQLLGAIYDLKFDCELFIFQKKRRNCERKMCCVHESLSFVLNLRTQQVHSVKKRWRHTIIWPLFFSPSPSFSHSLFLSLSFPFLSKSQTVTLSLPSYLSLSLFLPFSLFNSDSNDKNLTCFLMYHWQVMKSCHGNRNTLFEAVNKQ